MEDRVNFSAVDESQWATVKPTGELRFRNGILERQVRIEDTGGFWIEWQQVPSVDGD